MRSNTTTWRPVESVAMSAFGARHDPIGTVRIDGVVEMAVVRERDGKAAIIKGCKRGPSLVCAGIIHIPIVDRSEDPYDRIGVRSAAEAV